MKLDDNRPHLEITLKDRDAKGDLDPLAQETKRGWDSTEIILELDPPGSGILDSCSIQPGTSTARLVTKLGASYTVKEVRRVGPHFAPIIYQINEPGKSPGTPIKVADKGSVTIECGGRARISAWIDSAVMWNNKAPMSSDPNRIEKRWRGLTWGGLDDLTVLVSIWNVGQTDDVDWAENFVPASSGKPEKAKYFGQIIEMMHAQRVQVFAGMFSDTGVPGPSVKLGDAFTRWLRAKVAGQKGPLKPLFANHAKKAVDFFDNQGLDIDGISMDHEIFITSPPTPGMTALNASDRPAITALYQAYADELGKKGRYLAYANSAFTSHTDGISVWMPYELAQYPNIIARPMSYQSEQRRERVIKFALPDETAGAGLHPGQLQTGLATAMPPTSTPASIIAEVGKTQRKYRVGFIQFGFDGSSAPDKAHPKRTQTSAFAEYDTALNPDGPPHGTLGQPLQGPLNAERIAVLDKAAKT